MMLFNNLIMKIGDFQDSSNETIGFAESSRLIVPDFKPDDVTLRWRKIIKTLKLFSSVDF